MVTLDRKIFIGTYFGSNDLGSPYRNLINAIHEKISDAAGYFYGNESNKCRYKIIATVALDDIIDAQSNSLLNLTVEFAPETNTVLIDLHNSDKLLFSACNSNSDWVDTLKTALRQQRDRYIAGAPEIELAPQSIPDKYGHW